MNYRELIDSAALTKCSNVTVTSGDVEYSGTAMEICDENEQELFHIIVNSKGERQLLFFSQTHNYRITLSRMEEILEEAKKEVRFYQ